MKSVKQVQFVLLWCVFAAAAVVWSCKRDIPLPPGDKPGVHTVNFKLSGFESSIRPLTKAQTEMGRFPTGLGMDALLNITPGLEEQYLYYWSFNDETLLPDIAVDEVGAEITTNGTPGSPPFPAGFALDPFPAGQAMSIRGVTEIEIHMPIKGVSQITAFEFDISSSGTGPKDFSITYAVNGGTDFAELSANNPFEKMGDQARNPYRFGLEDITNLTDNESITIKIKLLANNQNYNPSSGVVRLDNIRLSGLYNGEPGTDPAGPDKLRYYIFSSTDGSVAAQRELAMSELDGGGILSVELEEGTYDILFLAYRAAGGILLPEALTNASAFYFGQHFNDRNAVTFAAMLADFEVGEADVNAAAVLERCYSLVEFSFEDTWTNLSAVKKIEIRRLHTNHLYAPFGAPSTPPVSTAQTITYDGLSDANDYDLAFHQFLGLPGAALPLSYQLVAYDAAGDVLKTVTVGESIPNNVILRFTGQLTGPTLPDRFAIQIKTDWDDIVESPF